MLGAAVRPDALAAELEPIQVTARLRIDDPAGELREGRLEIERARVIQAQQA